MSAGPLIQLEKVTKNYRIGDETVRALAGVSLEVAEGEFVALVGPSGSGKSTMLHVIGGLDSPSSGGVIVAGSNLSQASDNQLSSYRNRSVGFVFQTFNLHPTLNALENVALPLVFSGIPHRRRLEAARQALEEVGLAARAEHRPNQLSGGERQRVSIARALVAGPKIILADEPTGNLDSKTGERIVELLLRLNQERNITTVLVTHDLDIAARAPRIISMRDGSIVDERRA
jgi:putative ABC transport system ATP-binding protein